MASRPWIVLFVAALFEMGWAVGLEYSEGLTRLWPTIGVLASLVVSMALLAQAVRALPIGTAYAVWTGIGAVGTATYGIFAFGESAAPLRLTCIGLIVAGIAGLHLTA